MFYVYDYRNKKYELCPASSRSVFIKGYEGFVFFVHRPLISDDGIFGTERWTLSEVTTGGAIVYSEDTKHDAISIASEYLRNKPLSKLRNIIEEHVKKHGISPYFSNATSKENN